MNDRGYLDEDAQAVLRDGVRDAITKTLARDAPDADLLSVRIDAGDPLVVTATVVGVRPVRTLMEHVNSDVSKAIARPTTLRIRSVGSTSTVVRPADAGR